MTEQRLMSFASAIVNRRHALQSAACGFGGLALAGLTTKLAQGSETHFAPKAKRVIFLFMHGGVSQMDSFDRKPVLNQQHGNQLLFDLPGLIRPDRLGKVFGVKWNWDRYGSIEKNMPESAAQMDKPVAALIADLEQRGLLEETLVVWAGKFGRTPAAQIDRGDPGRDHNPHGFTIWITSD